MRASVELIAMVGGERDIPWQFADTAIKSALRKIRGHATCSKPNYYQ